MSAKFTDEDKDALRLKMLQLGFRMLKSGGIRSVNIDEITRECFVAKGSFYTLFESKTEFLYQVMIYKRQESKDKMLDYLDSHGKLSWDGLYAYLHWLADENPNIFSYLDGVSIPAGWFPNGRRSIWKMKRTTSRLPVVSSPVWPVRRKIRTGSCSVII